jgi:hypothetical protein
MHSATPAQFCLHDGPEIDCGFDLNCVGFIRAHRWRRLGWDLPVSYIQHDRTFARRRPASSPHDDRGRAGFRMLTAFEGIAGDSSWQSKL